MGESGLTRRQVLGAGAAGAASLALGKVGWAAGPEYDLVILHGRVIDPEGKLDAVRNVGIYDGTIHAVSTQNLRGRQVIDARGLVVAPGFIDIISHGQNLENDMLQALDGVTTKLQMEAGVADLDAWHREQAGHRMLNYGAGTSHGHARRAVMSEHNEEKPATEAQIRAMRSFVDHALSRGALGVGFGLEYTPATSRWEALEVFRAAGKYHASCHAHIRFGTLMEDQSVLDAVEEVIAASVVSGAPIHIVHVPSMALSDTPKALQMIHEAQQRGMDITCDFYPYTAFGTGSTSEVFAEGWQKRYGITYRDLEWAKTHERLTPESFAKYRQISGMIIAHAIPESAVRAAVTSPATMVGTDGGLDRGVGHPRSSGSYARILGRYVREQKLIPLHTAIEKMSLRPAKRLEKRCPAFKKKGRIAVGADADLAIFDPAKVIDRATYDQPALTSVGFRYVLVGGTPVVLGGKLQESARPGRGLRAPTG